MMNPQTQGLFRAAVLMSGSCLFSTFAPNAASTAVAQQLIFASTGTDFTRVLLLLYLGVNLI
jgi:hypothetical protein